VNFLHSTTLVISQARLPTYMYYSKFDHTYKLDRTTVTVGAQAWLPREPLLQHGLPLAPRFQ
jgi:hypothetical protein